MTIMDATARTWAKAIDATSKTDPALSLNPPKVERDASGALEREIFNKQIPESGQCPHTANHRESR